MQIDVDPLETTIKIAKEKNTFGLYQVSFTFCRLWDDSFTRESFTQGRTHSYLALLLRTFGIYTRSGSFYNTVQYFRTVAVHQYCLKENCTQKVKDRHGMVKVWRVDFQTYSLHVALRD